MKAIAIKSASRGRPLCTVSLLTMLIMVSAALQTSTSSASGQRTVPPRYGLFLRTIICDEETDEVGADEIYVVWSASDLDPAHAGTDSRSRTRSFRSFDEGDQKRLFGEDTFYKSLGERPENRLILVLLMEHDESGVDFAANAMERAFQKIASYAQARLARSRIINLLATDIRSYMRSHDEPGNADDIIAIQDVYISPQDVEQARGGHSVLKTLGFRGDGGRYRLVFELVRE